MQSSLTILVSLPNGIGSNIQFMTKQDTTNGYNCGNLTVSFTTQ